jgi:hypothetical protein
MKCPHCKKEMLETRPNVFYCQSKKCKIAYIILTGAKVRLFAEGDDKKWVKKE